MKKLIALLGFLASCSTLPIPVLAQDQITSDFAGSSTNYEAIYSNQDGSSSILRPRFSNPMGTGNMLLSIASDLNGVCLLFGFDSYVENSLIKGKLCPDCKYLATSVAIGPLGKFDRYVKDDLLEALSVIRFISCRKNKTTIPIPYTSVTKIQNDDGSTTLLKPLFLMNDSNYMIHNTTDPDAICKSFGLNRFVVNSMRSQMSCSGCRYRNDLIKIGSNGLFQEYVTETQPGTSEAVRSLICD